MFTRIIVGIDGLDGGRDALALAKRLAGKDTELVLVTSFPYELRPNRGSVIGYEELLRKDTVKELEEYAGDDPRCRVHAVGDMSPGHALHDAAEREHADLLVVGSCHRGAIGRVLLGDVSRATLHGAPCPVAVAPRGCRDLPAEPIHTIGVGFNGTRESAAALAFGARLAEAVGGGLDILTAVATPSAVGPAYAYAYDRTEIEAEGRLAAEQQLATAAAGLDVPAETEAIDERPGIALEHLSEHVALIVVGSRGWGASHRVVLGSTTNHLTHHAHCPVIAVPCPVADRQPPQARKHRISAAL